MAALTRMAEDTHRKIKIKPGDTVIFSSHPIPGNEKSVTNVINKLLVKGADVIFQDVHVSGHPCQEELKLIYSLVQPEYAIPVHGEYRHLIAQSRVVKSLGYDNDHIFILHTGDVLELGEHTAKVTGTVPTGSIVIVSAAMDAESQIVAGPEITSRGFVYLKEADVLMNEASVVTADAMDKYLRSGKKDRNKLGVVIRDSLGEFFWKKTKRRPMILPVILDV